MGEEKKHTFLILLMEEILQQLRLVVHPITYRVSYIQQVVGLGISAINNIGPKFCHA